MAYHSSIKSAYSIALDLQNRIDLIYDPLYLDMGFRDAKYKYWIEFLLGLFFTILDPGSNRWGPQ